MYIVIYIYIVLANDKQNEQSEWLQNSSFEPEASKLSNSIIEENTNKEHKNNVQNSYKLYKKLHEKKKKKKKDKKHTKKFNRSKYVINYILW